MFQKYFLGLQSKLLGRFAMGVDRILLLLSKVELTSQIFNVISKGFQLNILLITFQKHFPGSFSFFSSVINVDLFWLLKINLSEVSRALRKSPPI